MNANLGFFRRFFNKPIATFTTSALLLAIAFNVNQTAVAQPAGDELSAATREFLKATGAEKQYGLILNLMADGARDGARRLLAESLRTKPIEATSNEKANEIVNRLSEQYTLNARKAIADKLPWSRMVEEVYLPVYRRNFTVADLKTATEFHRSPVGKKMQEQNQAVSQDVTRALSELYGPVIKSESQPLAEEMIKKARVELEKLK